MNYRGIIVLSLYIGCIYGTENVETKMDMRGRSYVLGDPLGHYVDNGDINALLRAYRKSIREQKKLNVKRLNAGRKLKKNKNKK